jgi:hypothetical protein
MFHVTRGSVAGKIWLPWLGAKTAVLIAVNRHPGDDVAIALDCGRSRYSPGVLIK